MSSKNTHWRRLGNNIDLEETREEKELNRKKMFRTTLALERMKTNKPHFKKTSKHEDLEIE